MKIALFLSFLATASAFAEEQSLAKYSLIAVLRRIEMTVLLSKDDPVPAGTKFAYPPPSSVRTNIIREGMAIDRGHVGHVDKSARTVEFVYDDGKRTVIHQFPDGIQTNYWVEVRASNGERRQVHIGQRLDDGWTLASVAPTAATFTNKTGRTYTLRPSEDQTDFNNSVDPTRAPSDASGSP